MAVVLIGTLDTKGTELKFVQDLLHRLHVPSLVVDAGVIGPPTFPPDISRRQVFAAAGTSIESLQQEGHRGRAIEAAARGAAKVAVELFQQGKLDGILALGGSAGTTIGTAAMRALPLGVPKLMVSTLASGDVKPYVGVRDIFMLPSVVDISGLNRISRLVLTNAALAMAGMMRKLAHPSSAAADKPLIAATMFGVTTPCVDTARRQLEARHYEVLVFHATGTGGQTMESFIADGLIAGVLDITTTELADELVGGVLTAGPGRLTAAACRGTPQVISLGALDMVNFGPPQTVPSRFSSRRFFQHNPTVTLMRTTPEENDRLGKEIAEKASASRGPTAVLVPRRGLSAIDCEGGPFWWPEADAALFQSLRNWLSPNVELVELDLHINDPDFAAAAVETLLRISGK